MPKAIFYLTWDLGKTTIEKTLAKFPIKESKITSDLPSILKKANLKIDQAINHVLLEKLIIIIIPISSKSENKILELVLLILDQKEAELLEKFKTMLKTEAIILKNTTENEKKEKFLDFAKTVISQSMPKIVLMGLPDSGKQGTKLFYFDKIQELKLIDKSIAPTQGFETQLYEIMALNVSVFDTSGQELERWFKEPEIVLAETEIIIFFFSVNDWQVNKEKVIDYLKKLKDFVSHADHPIILKIFCHKFDLIKEKKEEFKKDVNNSTSGLKLSMMFTSIVNGGNFDLLNSFYFLFKDFSYLVNQYNNSIEPLIKHYGYRPLLLFDEKFSPLASFEINEKEINDISQIRNYFLEWISLNQKSLQKPIKMVFFSFNKTFKLIGFIQLTDIFQKFSYIAIGLDSFSQIDIFRENLEKFSTIIY